MKQFQLKIDGDETEAGVVSADEHNSAFSELKGAVTPYFALNEFDNTQLAKSIDINSKAITYNDTGAPNAVHLVRSATSEQIETLFDGMTLFFSPANTNTGASTLKVNGLTAKPVHMDGAALSAGMLRVKYQYMAVYSLAGDRFDISLISTGGQFSENVLHSGQSVVDADGNKLYAAAEVNTVGFQTASFSSVSAWTKITSLENTDDSLVSVSNGTDIVFKSDGLYIIRVDCLTRETEVVNDTTSVGFLGGGYTLIGTVLDPHWRRTVFEKAGRYNAGETESLVYSYGRFATWNDNSSSKITILKVGA